MSLIHPFSADEIRQYCDSEFADRMALLDSMSSARARPAYLLPIFELCHVVHFWARKKQDPRLFRACWEEFVSQLWSRSDSQGHTVAILDSLEGEDVSDKIRQVVNATFEHHADEEESPGADARDRALLHKALVARMRFMYSAADPRPYRSPWEEQPPEPLPAPKLAARVTRDLVLDTNNTLELMQNLKFEDGRLRLPPLPRLSERAVRQFKRALETNGKEGKLIIPTSVLEETERVARRKAHKYSGVTRRLNEIAFEPGRSPWGALDFEDLSFDVFAVFLRMHELLFSMPDVRWPSLGDALVLAHGLFNGCAVASSEWTEKQDWRYVKQCFPFLADS